jgi:excisionase family DNA binding protein
MEKNTLTMALTPEQASEQLHCHINTIYALLKNGRLPHIKLSRRYLISRIELEKWLAGQYKQTPTGGATP